MKPIRIFFVMIGIYKITSPSGRVYVGQSIDINRRWKTHKRLLKNKTTKLHNSFKKYGVENHKFEVIEECYIDKLDERELFWQIKYDSVNNGLNCEYVVFLASIHVRSDYVRDKISKTMKVITKTKSHQDKLKNNVPKGKNHYLYKEVISTNNNSGEQLLMGLCETSKYFNVKTGTIKKRCESDTPINYIKKLRDWTFRYNYDYTKSKIIKKFKSKQYIICVNRVKNIYETLTYKDIYDKYNINKKLVLNKIKNNVIHERDEINDWEFYYKDKIIKKSKYVFYSRKFILDLETGIYYYSVLDLSNAINKSVSSINNMLNRKSNNFNKRYIQVKNNK